MDLAGDGLRGVVFEKTADRPEDLEDGQVGNTAPVREAVAFEICGWLPCEALTKLEQETRLPDTGLADERHELPLSLAGGFQAAREQVELIVAADEAPDAAAEVKGGLAVLRQLVGAHRCFRACACLRDAEPPRQQRHGGLTHDDRVGSRGCDEAVEYRPYVPLCVAIDVGHGTDTREGNALDVNGGLEGGACGLNALVAKRGLVHRHRCMRRPPRRGLHRPQT